MGRDKGKGVKRSKSSPSEDVPTHPRLSRRPAGALEQTMQQAFDTPFILQHVREGNLYKALSKRVNPHAYIDLDDFEMLRIRSELRKYLQVLGCEKFATSVWIGYEELALEFVCTFARVGTSSDITCRLMGEEITVTLPIMHRVFGFSKARGAILQVPPEFNTNSAWYELTGFNNWNSSGMSPGFLQDRALLVLHKFLSFSIMGKKEATKVNAMEVYLLWAAKNEVQVSLTGFIWKQIEALLIQQKGTAGWAHIATGIAMSMNFDLPQLREVRSIPINVGSIKRGHYLLDDGYTWKPYENRGIVIQQRRLQGGGAGPSSSTSRRAPSFDEDRMEEEAAYEAAHEHHFDFDEPVQDPSYQPFQNPPPFEPSHAPQDQPPLWQYQYNPQSGAPPYFEAFQQQFFSQFQQFNTRFDGLCTDVASLGSSVASLTTSMGNMNLRLDSVDRRMKGLEDSWNHWNQGPQDDEENDGGDNDEDNDEEDDEEDDEENDEEEDDDGEETLGSEDDE